MNKEDKRKYDREYYAKLSRFKKHRKNHMQLLRKKRIAGIVREYLSIHPCIDCGESDVIVLEFDHARGTKEHNISDMVRKGRSLKSIQNEIIKCDIRCANRHRRKHATIRLVA